MSSQRLRFFKIFLMAALGAMAQDGLYVNGTAAALFVPTTNFISCEGSFGVLRCDPLLQVRFSGSLYVTSHLICNDLLRFNPAQAADSKLCRAIFLPGNQSIISGSVSPVFWELEIDKGIGNSVLMANSIICRDSLHFKSGFLYINGRHCTLQDPVGATDVLGHPWIKGERNGSQFLASNSQDTGKVIYNSIYTSSVNFQAANIGIRILGPVNIGSPICIIRGFKNQINAAKGSIGKYMDIYSPGHNLVNNILSFNYYLNDAATSPFNYINTAALRPYIAPLGDFNWTPFSFSLTTAAVNYSNINGNMQIDLTQMRHPFNFADSNAFRVTLADPACSSAPVSQLGADTVHICAGDSLILDPVTNSSIPNTSLRFSWSTLPACYTRTLQVKPDTAYRKLHVLLMDVRGCSTRDSVIIAPAAPIPQITYFNFLNACLGDSVLFKDTVRITSGTYTTTYSFSDQTALSTNQNTFRKKFNLSGIYTVTLNTASEFGCRSSATRTNVQVYPPPLAAYNFSLNCLTRQMDFSNLSISNSSLFSIANSRWTFGGLPAGSSTLSSPSHSFAQAGNYSVKLRCKTSFGCSDSITQIVAVSPQNNAQFNGKNICLGDTNYFQNISTCATGSCSNYWDFGDQTNDTSPNAIKIYQSAGLYFVKLKITASLGCPDSLSIPFFVNARPAPLFSLSTRDACPNEVIYCSNTSSLASGVITAINWQLDNQANSSNWNYSASSSFPGLHTIKLSLVSDSGCTASTISTLIVHPAPQAQVYANPVCQGDTSYYLSVFQSPLFVYQLDPGLSSGSATYTQAVMPVRYSQAGTYTAVLVVLSNYGCSDTSSFTHNVKPVPLSPFQGSISTCGDSYLLDALNNGSVFSWWPGNQITNTVLCQQNGKYQVTITHPNGCTRIDKVDIQLNSIVQPLLGKDTSVCGQILLNAGYPGANFQWNTGNTAQHYLATSSGTYAVTVTDQNNCTGVDTIVLLVKSIPLVNTGPDLIRCRPKNSLSLTANGNANSYIWNTGQTGTLIAVDEPGLYWAEGSALNGCKIRDSVLLSFLKTPFVNLGGILSACDKLHLDAKNNGSTFLWEDGSTSATRVLNSSAKIWIRVTEPQSGCAIADTADVIIHEIPVFNLGRDTSVCNNTLYILNTGSIQGTVKWTDGSSAKQLTVASTGLYGATITNLGTCQYSDYVFIKKLVSPKADLGLPFRYLCGDKNLTFSCADTIALSWYFNGLAFSTYSDIVAAQPGHYKLKINNGFCVDEDSVLVARTNQTIQAQFLASTIDTVNRSIKFVNLSKPAASTSWWDFGDGQQSEEDHPEHTWLLPADFKVRLKVSNGFCEDEVSSSLRVIFRQYIDQQKSDQGWEYRILFYPNPSADELNIHAEFSKAVKLELLVNDLNGRMVFYKNYASNDFFSDVLALPHLSQGLYFIHFRAENATGRITKTEKLIIEK